ncbi:uncharacterized protein At1g76070 [Henckelia pumila]|uniref:uncharacterized protein At1g76070 n=1 Tax=Henckelia pumila TaxID=405737 RepID=UPI003C6E2C65
MEKPITVKPKSKILNLVSKAAQVSFQNLPFSPGRRTHHNKGFSGPIMTSMIPPEARGRSKNFETQEPTSPKVSCMGQIKHRKKISCKKKPERAGKPKVVELKKKPSGVWKLFGPGRKSDASINYNPPPQQNRPSSAEGAPSLGQMRKFASSRDTFANFDWSAAQIAPEKNSRRDCDYSDEERGYSDGEDNEVIIPFSAPILMAGVAVEPRKEINLWKRRTMARPKPLQLNKIR